MTKISTSLNRLYWIKDSIRGIDTQIEFLSILGQMAKREDKILYKFIKEYLQLLKKGEK
jgi:hypothetical protein